MPYSAQTTLLTLDPNQPDAALMTRAAGVIRAGGLVAFPTETVYGLGANALDATACERIFAAKQRPATDPLIVHLASVDDLTVVALDVPPLAGVLAARFWPGALTLVLNRAAAIPDVVTAGQDTVAVRVPSHPVAQALIRAAGVPIAAPSANRFSRPSPTTAHHVLADLAGRVDMVLDGGAANIGVESTIVDLTDTVPTVLRPGGISLEALRDLLPNVQVRTLAMTGDQAAPVPGTLLKHYSPDSELILYTGEEQAVNAHIAAIAHEQQSRGSAVVILLVGEAGTLAQPDLNVISLGEDAAAAANRLFAVLRDQEQKADMILVRAPQQTGLGLALWDRLWRAAEGRIVLVE